MLNAEDTKERIRKLRLKVISDPTDINSTSNTQDVQKTTNGLEDKLVVKNKNKEAFSDTEAIGIDEKQSNKKHNSKEFKIEIHSRMQENNFEILEKIFLNFIKEKKILIN